MRIPTGESRVPFALTAGILFLLLLPSLAPVGAVATDGSEVEALVERGRKLLRKGKLDQAVDVLRQADEAAEGISLEALRLLAVAYRRQHEDEAALEASLRVFRMQPAAELNTLFFLVSDYDRAGRAEEILPLLEEYLAAEPEPAGAVWAENERGIRILEGNERRGESISPEANRAFLRAYELSEGQAVKAARNMAETLRRQGHAAEAREVVEGISPARPGSTVPLRVLPLGGDLEELWHERYSGRAVHHPTRIHSPPAQYTEQARKARIQGVVILNVRVEETGRHEIVKVIKGLPMGLTEAAIEAVERWRFEPARDEAGRPAPSETEVIMNFSLQ